MYRKNSWPLMTVSLAFALVTACGGEKKAVDEARDIAQNLTPPGEVPPPQDPEAKKDSFQGTYKTLAHQESDYRRCEVMKDVRPANYLNFFALETYWSIREEAAPGAFELWLHRCESGEQCGRQQINFVMYDRKESHWEGVSATGLSDSLFEEGKCNFYYTFREARFKDDLIVIESTRFTGDVDPVNNESCEAHSTWSEDYLKAYFGKLECSSYEKIVGEKVSDAVPLGQ